MGILGSIGKYKAQKKAAKENRKAAIENLKLVYNDLNALSIQESAAASQEAQMASTQAAGLRGETTVSAAAGNVGGASVDALLNDVSRQESEALSVINTNLGFKKDQIRRRQRGAQAQAVAQINGVPQPSMGALALDIAGTALNTYSLMKR